LVKILFNDEVETTGKVEEKFPKIFLQQKRFEKINKNKALITVAITGDVPAKNRLAAVPTTPKEQIQDIIKCFEAGARMVHIHVRDDEGKPTWQHNKYKEVFEGVKKFCPEMLVQFSTGNYATDIDERTECFKYKPHMASLTPGSVNFRQTRLSANHYLNSHEEIVEMAKRMLLYNIVPDVAIFDLSMIYAAEQLVRQNLIKLPIRLMYVFGGHMALPARKEG
jgi:3-keto-5-aminohexanoate cleavage enzyme